MCDHCCIESVKNRMLSRRALLGGSAALAAAALTPTAPAQAQGISIANGKPVDLTYELYPDFPTYFGQSGFSMEPKFTYAKEKFNLNIMTINEHTGTHIDAPLHFSENGQSVAEIPVENLVVPLSIVHIHERAAKDPDAQVTPDDLKAWIAKHGPLPKGGCVAMHSGWGKHVATAKFRNADSEGKMHFPGFHVEAAKMLIEDGNTVGIASDTLSLDHGISGDFATHYAWLPTGRWGIENIANLEALPANGATLFVGASKHRGGSGGPARIIAVV
ncbi:MAG: cyclase family protein [Hyphomicrobiaceae bacterium]